MPEVRRRFDPDFRAGAVRIVKESGGPIARVARDLGINGGTLANWVARDRQASAPAPGALAEDERAELARLRRENAELAMERDVLIGRVRARVGRAVGDVWCRAGELLLRNATSAGCWDRERLYRRSGPRALLLGRRAVPPVFGPDARIRYRVRRLRGDLLRDRLGRGGITTSS